MILKGLSVGLYPRMGRNLRRNFCAVSTKPEPTKEEIQEAKVIKKDMMKLRRKTGYSYVNIKKALVMYGEDLANAEKYLHKLAKEQGWAKAEKVQSRRAAQGLIGIVTERNFGAMVEMNCETDFVAKNPKFRHLVCATAITAMRMGMMGGKGCWTFNNQAFYDSHLADEVEVVPGRSGKEYFTDVMNEHTQTLGEKLVMNRAYFMSFPDESAGTVHGYTHPKEAESNPGNVLLGEYGSLVGLQRFRLPAEGERLIPLQFMGQQLGQHIVGMNPKKLGELPADAGEVKTEPDEFDDTMKDQKPKKEGEDGEEEEEEEDFTEAGDKLDMDEKRLLHQTFLFDPNSSVGQFVTTNGVLVRQFCRYQVGEPPEDED